MEKTRILQSLVTDFIALAEDLQELADILSQGEKVSQPEPKAVELKPEVQTIKLEDVRAVLAEKSHGGKIAEVRALLEKYGASKLSSIDPSHYPELLSDAEKL